jgi:hypothetical protein
MATRKRRGRKKKRKTKMTAVDREFSLYDGQNFIGTIKESADGTTEAFDLRGKRLGTYASFKEATRAFNHVARTAHLS